MKRCECWNCKYWEPRTDRRGTWGYCNNDERARIFERPQGEMIHRESWCGLWRHYKTDEDYRQWFGIEEAEQ
ncbi:MAG: hypothetical protein ACTSYX_04900 [Candidatus Thorarchaeota archaeon]